MDRPTTASGGPAPNTPRGAASSGRDCCPRGDIRVWGPVLLQACAVTRNLQVHTPFSGLEEHP